MIDPFSIAKSTTNTPSNTYRYTDNRRVILTIKTVFATESQTQNERAIFTKLPVVEIDIARRVFEVTAPEANEKLPAFSMQAPACNSLPLHRRAHMQG